MDYFSSYDKETQIAIRLLDTQICERLGIMDMDERKKIIQTILEEYPSVLKNLYILNIYSGADYQGLMKRILFDVERKYRFLTEEGLNFLFDRELAGEGDWKDSPYVKLDENGNVVAIQIQDAQDGGYTLGAGIFLSQDYPDRIELAESLGIDWDNTNEWVSMEDVNILYSDIAQDFHDYTKNVEVRTGKIFTSKQYDAVFSLLYWKPFLDETIIKLIRTNANQEDWIKNIKDALKEQYGDNIFEKYPGWIPRIERTVELYFGGEY